MTKKKLQIKLANELIAKLDKNYTYRTDTKRLAIIDDICEIAGITLYDFYSYNREKPMSCKELKNNIYMHFKKKNMLHPARSTLTKKYNYFSCYVSACDCDITFEVKAMRKSGYKVKIDILESFFKTPYQKHQLQNIYNQLKKRDENRRDKEKA